MEEKLNKYCKVRISFPGLKKLLSGGRSAYIIALTSHDKEDACLQKDCVLKPSRPDVLNTAFQQDRLPVKLFMN
jgi:hypothetical protein